MAGVLELDHLQGPLQRKQFYDSVIVNAICKPDAVQACALAPSITNHPIDG